MRRFSVLPVVAACLAAPAVLAQKAAPSASSAPISIASVSLQGVRVSGSLSVADGRAVIGNNGTITAGDTTAHVRLARGGALDVCSSTKIHLATDSATEGRALMIALDRGAFEAHYKAGQFSDVILTPDLRILVSPPGQVDLSLRVNQQGDTCIDNHGSRAPYVLATNLFAGGAYRIQPNQRVLFEHGSLDEVVDNETEPCGCPPPQPPATAIARSGKKAASQAAARNPFPLAESEGLQPPPAPPVKPEKPGVTHAEVQAPLAYNSAKPNLPPPPGIAAASPAPANAPARRRHRRGFFRSIGHFFRHIFRRR